jgi:hypothetical protein
VTDFSREGKADFAGKTSGLRRQPAESYPLKNAMNQKNKGRPSISKFIWRIATSEIRQSPEKRQQDVVNTREIKLPRLSDFEKQIDIGIGMLQINADWLGGDFEFKPSLPEGMANIYPLNPAYRRLARRAGGIVMDLARQTIRP